MKIIMKIFLQEFFVTVLASLKKDEHVDQVFQADMENVMSVPSAASVNF